MVESKKRFMFANWNAHSVLNKKQEIEAMLSLHDDNDKLAITKMDLPIPHGDVFEAVGISVCSPLCSIAVVCAYVPPNSGADLLTWRSLFARVPTGLVSDLDLVSLNDSSPTFLAGRGVLCNYLDLVFLSASLSHLASSYVGDDSIGSDHLPVLC